MFNPSREQARLFFCKAWQKHRERLPLEGAESTVVDLIGEHPEYHALLEKPDAALEQEFTPEGGKMNPFLHLSLHLAIAEQISIDQPCGIRAAYHALRERRAVHDAEHALMECLGETLWHAQRNKTALNSQEYLARIQRSLLKAF